MFSYESLVYVLICIDNCYKDLSTNVQNERADIFISSNMRSKIIIRILQWIINNETIIEPYTIGNILTSYIKNPRSAIYKLLIN